MGGSGKTQLALEFCRHAEEDLGFTAVFWINASSQVSVVQSYRVIAREILEHHQVNADSGNLISLVQDNLRKRKSLWLFVFDNYDNPKAFETTNIYQYIPKGKKGRVLFTSRHQDSARLGHTVEVSGMTQDESLQVLFQRPPLNDEESRYGKEIAAQLGNLVLALDQAGSYLRARNVRLCDYVPSYRKRKEHILKETPDVWEYRNITNNEEREVRLTVFTTWQLSFDQISGDEQERRQKEYFLTLAAFFDINAISDRYFEAYFNAKKPEWMAILSSEGRWDIHKLENVLVEFNKLSLIQMKQHAMDQQLFSIHPVVRDWIQLRQSRERRRQFAQEFIETVSSYLTGVDIVDFCLNCKSEAILQIDSYVELAKELSSGSSYSILDDHPDAMTHIGRLYQLHLRDKEAIEMFKRALSVNLKNSGATHLNTLRSKLDLAFAYRTVYRLDDAEKILDQLLIDEDKVLEANDPLKTVTMLNLAEVYELQKRHNEAEQLYQKLS